VKVRLICGATMVAALALTGCKKKVPTAEVPSDIRGAPINNIALAPAPVSAATNIVESKSSAASLQKDESYLPIGFDKLAGYQIEISDELLAPQTNKVATSADAQIPEAVKKLSNKKISLRGFMLPLKVEGGLVTELLIMKDQSMCCYGTTPRINEWVSVKMKNGGVKPLMDEPVTLVGTLKVGEARENGYLVGIYALDGEKMLAPN
jgi:hypothetical protein